MALLAIAVAALLLVSGGSGADPRTPAALPGLPPPFLGTTVVGAGELTAAIDSYGDVVDLRPSPAGPALIENPAERQAAGTVPAQTGIVPRVRIADGPALPFWRADSVRQHYQPGTNVVVTTARFGRVRASVRAAGVGNSLVLLGKATSGAHLSFDDNASGGRIVIGAPRLLLRAAGDEREWLSRARPLGMGAPRWARRLYCRSLLTLRALTDARDGAVAAGARDGWAYVWPRDAATAALAFEAAGYTAEARRVAHFLATLELGAGARFRGDESPVPGRGPQGDSSGWVTVAARATAVPLSSEAHAAAASVNSADTSDYQETAPGEYLANALSQPRASGILARFGTSEGLVRRAGDQESGLDSAAAWAVRPFTRPALFGATRETLARLLARGTRFGITPGEDWSGPDPWTAPTAWSAWSFAALSRSEANHPELSWADRRHALRLLADLRRAATPAGDLPERVDARTGVPRSTTPLAWSHAFAVLALRQLWPTPPALSARYAPRPSR